MCLDKGILLLLLGLVLLNCLMCRNWEN